MISANLSGIMLGKEFYGSLIMKKYLSLHCNKNLNEKGYYEVDNKTLDKQLCPYCHGK